MKDAPTDRNILVRTVTYGYSNRSHSFEPTGFKWVEAHYAKDPWGRGDEWVQWCGNARTNTTDSLDAVDWMEFPNNTKTGKDK